MQEEAFRGYLEACTALGRKPVSDTLSRARRWETAFHDDLDAYMDQHGLDAALHRCGGISGTPGSIADVRTALRHYARFRGTQ